jgi:hypothetical protein
MEVYKLLQKAGSVVAHIIDKPEANGLNNPPVVVQMRRVIENKLHQPRARPMTYVLRLVYFPLQVIVECGQSHARQGCLSCQNGQTVSVDFGRKKVNP